MKSLSQVMLRNYGNRRGATVQRHLATALEVVLLAVLAFVFARLILLIGFGASAGDFAIDHADPRNAASQSSARLVDVAEADYSQLFADRRRTEVVVAQAVVPETRLNLELRGIRRGADPRSGAALLQIASGVQSFVSVGEEITDGVELMEVHADHVLISRRGIIESLYIREAAGRAERTASPAPEATEAAPAERSIHTPRQIASARGRPGQRLDINGLFQVEPRYIDDTIVGYAFVAGNRSLLEAVGLRMNDILVEVAGQPVSNADQIEALFNELGENGEAQIRVVRSGIALVLTVEMP